jgi:hypothetical protein
MIIVMNISFPTESAKKMGESFINAPPLPDFLTRRGPYISSTNTEGVKSLSIFELESSNIAEGMTAVSDYATSFFGVPGFAYEIKVNFDVKEALKMIGLG